MITTIVIVIRIIIITTIVIIIKILIEIINTGKIKP